MANYIFLVVVGYFLIQTNVAGPAVDFKQISKNHTKIRENFISTSTKPKSKVDQIGENLINTPRKPQSANSEFPKGLERIPELVLTNKDFIEILSKFLAVRKISGQDDIQSR